MKNFPSQQSLLAVARQTKIYKQLQPIFNVPAGTLWSKTPTGSYVTMHEGTLAVLTAAMIEQSPEYFTPENIN